MIGISTLKINLQWKAGGCSYRESLLRIFCLCLLLVSFPGQHVKAQSAPDYKWGNVAIGGGGFVSAIIPGKTEQGLMYARTDVGGAYRWDAANKEWIPLLDWVSDNETGYLGVESLAIDEQNPGRVFMQVGISYFNGGKTAILRSDDYGNTFTIIPVTSQFKAHGNGMGRQTGEKLAIDPNNSNILYTGTRWNGLFKSLDAGDSWRRVNVLNVTTTPNENGISFVLLDPSTVSGGATQTLYVGVSTTGTNLYKSEDGGATFTPVAGAPTNFMPQRAKLAPDGNLYITYGNGAGPHGHWAVPEPMDQGQIWKYNTQTGTWTNITPNGITRAFGGISIDPNNPNRLVASTINTYMRQYATNTANTEHSWGDRIFLSTDGGGSWTDVIERGMSFDPNGINWIFGHSIHWAGSIEFDPFDTKKVWVTSGNGIFMTENIEANPNVWKFMVQGLEETVPLNLISIPNGPLVSVIGDYDGFRHTDITQYAPIHQPRTGTTTGLAYVADNPDLLLRAGDKMFYSTNGGVNWTETSSMGKKGQVAVSADGKVFLHSPEGSNVTYRSTNNGASWSAVSGLSILEARPVADPENAEKFYAYDPGTGRLMMSTDAGQSFSATGTAGIGGSKVIRAIPGWEGQLWVPLYGGGLTRSTNSGQTFTKVNGVSAATAVGYGVAAPGNTYPTLYLWGTVEGITGIYRSTDEGVSWVRLNDDAHEWGGPGNGQFVVGDMNVFGRVYMSTAGRGIVYGEPAEGTSTCPPARITAKLQINGGTVQQSNSVEVAEGALLKLSPEVSAPAGSWNWSGPGNFSASSREVSLPEFDAQMAGDYVVTFTNDCGVISRKMYTVSLGSVTALPDREFDKKEVLLYPNPSTDGSFRIEIPQLNRELQIRVYNELGSLVHEQRAVNGNTAEVKAGLRAGIYFIRIISREAHTSRKLVVQ